MKIKTSELSGAQLDWAVAKCEGVDKQDYYETHNDVYMPSTDWAQAGPIIEREKIAVWPDEEGGFFASANEGAGKDHYGPTLLIAAMRCYVASKLGDEIEIPDTLLETA